MAASTLKPPTYPRGRVSEFDYDTLLDEWFADTPAELTWPLNIQTYAAMRRDSTVTAIQQGYTLQLRRAQWQLDGRGVDPKTTRLVADDMGLPVLGEDQHGAARTRGVSWSEHLRVALAQSLTFGHSGFALGANLTAGQARLQVLAERPPWTIDQIHADATTGEFLGVTQSGTRPGGAPEIRARDMAWYCLDREGANWAGRSMYYSAWLPWLIKREMIRVHASSNRRWGAGVPVMEALPGTAPSSGEMTAAAAMASAARAGEQAGAASPPGFQLKILGLSGAVPDTLQFMQWLDTQVTRASLMSHLELGQGGTGGAYALGQAFIDSWVLALEPLGESIAGAANRQIAARVVEWNYGTEAPVPRVSVAGVGSRREVTAESLKQLLDSGALSAEPALEAWVRREYRLPEREGMVQPAPSVRGDTVTAANRKPRARASRRKESPAGQLMLPVAAAADDSFKQMQADWEQARADLLAGWPDGSADLIEELAAAAADAVAEDRTADLGDLVASAAVVAAIAVLLDTAMTDLGELAAAAAVAELAAAGKDTEAPDDPGADRIDDLSEAYAGQVAGGYASAAGRKALTMAGPDADRRAVEDAVRTHLEGMSAAKTGLAGDTFSAALSAAQTVCRRDVFAAFPDATYIAVETNDKNQCSACKAIDSAEFDGLAAAEAAYPAGGYVSCAGGSRCRGGYTIKN